MKSLLTAFVLCFTLNTSFAQVWVDEGAVWHYDYWNVAQEGFYEIKQVADTTIDGQLCKAFDGKRYSYGMSEPGGDYVLIGESDLTTNYTYVSGDTVFYRDHDAFYVMLNFGAEVGDTWIISTHPYWESCDDTSRIEVMETGSITIGGEDYRTITVEPTSNSPFGFVGTFVERFGNISGSNPFITTFPSGYECDSMDAIVEWDYVGFSCFEDDSFTLYNPSGEDCDWWRVNVGLAEDELSKLSVYPNPANASLTIQHNLPNNQSFSVF